MTPAQSLLVIMIDKGMEIYPGTLESLQEALDNEHVYFFDDDGVPAGFVTWYFECGDLIMNNLCVFSKHGMAKLFTLRKFLHEKYPNLARVRWHDQRRRKDVEYGFI
jgi:hypothetical protein